jgi:hypothetical protein
MADLSSAQSFTIDGKEWSLMPFILGMKTKFSDWMIVRSKETALDLQLTLQRQARKLRQQIFDDDKKIAQGLESDLSELDREEVIGDVEFLMESAARQLKEFKDDKDTGRLHFTGSKCVEAMRTTEGTVKMMQLVLEPKHPGMKLEEIMEIYKKNQNAWVDAIREVAGLGKKLAPKTDTTE